MCLSALGLQAQLSIDLPVFASGFSAVTDIRSAGDDRLFVVEQAGTIRIVDARGNTTGTFLDISGPVLSGGERGLLGLVFHPDYATNGFFFVNYTNSSGDTHISRFSVDPLNPNVADPSSEEILLVISQPFSNHNAGCLQFGPDGYLYIAMGDGGSAGDPGNRSQNPLNLLGKMLRIDVDSGLPYTVPADNPFVGDPGVADEIWAIGLRNPWRFSFDDLTGDLWIADVGQDDLEEVNVVPASSTGGENYGWRCYEGNSPFNLSGCGPIGDYTFPVYEYTHSFGSGGFSITGGYVYRGQSSPNLEGRYIFCDYLSGNWWTLEETSPGAYSVEAIGRLKSFVTTFGQNDEGELFCSNGSQIFRIVETCTAGSQVVGLDAQVLSPTSVSLAWDEMTGIQGYRVNGRPIGAPSFSALITTTNSVNVNILSPSTSYEWFVQVRCTDGTIGNDSDLSNFTTPTLRESNGLFVSSRPNGWIFQTEDAGIWTITDLAGRTITQGQHADGTVEIDAMDLPSGIYIISSHNESGQTSSSLVQLSR
jgi:glucose/arabinose dehydrogenase